MITHDKKNQSSRNSQEVSVESLLQLKRYEQPSHEMWESFEADLKRRTLREIVKKENIFVRLGRQSRTLLHPSLALPATAMIALLVFIGTYPLSRDATEATSVSSVQPTDASEVNMGKAQDITPVLDYDLMQAQLMSDNSLPSIREKTSKITEIQTGSEHANARFVTEKFNTKDDSASHYRKLRATRSVETAPENTQYAVNRFSRSLNSNAIKLSRRAYHIY